MTKIKNTKTYETSDGRKVEEFDLEMTLFDENTDGVDTTKTIKEITTPEQVEALANRIATGKTNNKIVTRGDEDAGKNVTKKTVNVEQNTTPVVEPAKPREETTSTTANNNKIVRR